MAHVHPADAHAFQGHSTHRPKPSLHSDQVVPCDSLVQSVGAYVVASCAAVAYWTYEVWRLSRASALVAVGASAVAVLALISTLCCPRSSWASTATRISLASVLMQISVPLMLALLCAPLPGGRCGVEAANHSTNAQSLLLLLACLPGALFTLPQPWTEPGLAAAGIGFAVVYGVLFEHPTPSEPFARVAFTLLILLLMVWSGRRHHLSRSASEQPFGPSVGGHAHIRPAAESSFCSSVASAILHPVRRSAARDSLPLGADHTVDVSTDVEQALLELRQLQMGRGRMRSSTRQTTAVDRAIELLEASMMNTHGQNATLIDWEHEIQATGMNESVGEWLMATLASQQGDAGSKMLYEPSSASMSLKKPYDETPRRSSTSSSSSGGAPSVLEGTVRVEGGGGGAGDTPKRLSFLSSDQFRRASFTKRSKQAANAPRDADNDSYHSDSSDSMTPNTQRRKRYSGDRVEQAGSPLSEAAVAARDEERRLPPLDTQLRLLADEARPMAEKALRGWGADLVAMNNVTDGHALYLTAMSVLERHDLVAACKVDPAALRAFLLRIESKYGSSTYHNSVHGADVMLHMHLLLDLHGLTKRLSKPQLFAAFLGALIHDFNHPGSNNAHEIKTGSLLALTYSDSSVLERHHLASSFAVMRTKGYDILSGLSPDDYKTVRSTVIELVLSTDLAGHFDSLVKLRALSATRGRAAYDAAAPAAGAPTPLDPSGAPTTTMAAVTRRRSIDSSALMRRRSMDTAGPSCGSSGAQRSVSPGNARPSASSSNWHSPFLDEDVDVHLVLTTAIKFADLNHAAKPWSQHIAWSERITDEFWAIGDKEKRLGVSVSPLCDREVDTDLAGTQVGFFQFICNPFYELVADLIDPDMPPYAQLQSNFATWKEKHQSRLSK